MKFILSVSIMFSVLSLLNKLARLCSCTLNNLIAVHMQSNEYSYTDVGLRHTAAHKQHHNAALNHPVPLVENDHDDDVDDDGLYYT